MRTQCLNLHNETCAKENNAAQKCDNINFFLDCKQNFNLILSNLKLFHHYNIYIIMASRGASSFIGANEDMFLQAFDSTPKLNIATQKKLEYELSKVITIISNPNAEWDSRVQAIKHFRSLINSAPADLDDYHVTTLKSLEIPFQNNICDLRSQVVRETCITIAFLSCRLQQKFSRMAEVLLPSLIKLIPNSAKIISTSALVALRFIIQSTHSSRLIAIIKYQLSTSKSKDIHRALCEIVERIVTIWSPATLERHLNDLTEVLRLGICDSDEAARQYARRAFNIFAEHFREPADRLFNSLDQQRQRMLNNLNHGGGSTLSMNGYGSTATSLNIVGQTSTISSSIPSSQHYHSSGYGPNSASGNVLTRLKSSMTTSTNGTANTTATSGNNVSASPSRIRTPTARSTSAIDVSAQKRARARAVYLSSMYTRPRQIGTTTVNSPAKPSHVPSPVISHYSNVTYQQHTPSSSASTSTLNHKNHLTPVAQQHYHQPHQQQQQHSQLNQSNINQNNHHPQNHACNSTPNNTPHQQLQQLQQQQAASAEKRDGVALSKAASYLLSVMDSRTVGENQVVTTCKYFNSLIEKHPIEIVNQYLSELMPPLVLGIDNPAISVRKASVFAMVAIHAKVGLTQMESYLTSLTMTQRKLLDVYINKFKEENKSRQGSGVGGDISKETLGLATKKSSSSILNSNSQHQVSSSDLI